MTTEDDARRDGLARMFAVQASVASPRGASFGRVARRRRRGRGPNFIIGASVCRRRDDPATGCHKVTFEHYIKNGNNFSLQILFFADLTNNRLVSTDRDMGFHPISQQSNSGDHHEIASFRSCRRIRSDRSHSRRTTVR
jgi:hypothetical protein